MTEIVDSVIHDHNDIRTFYNEYQHHAGNAQEQKKWANQYMWEVARHSVAEEIVVYPAFEKYLSDGKDMAGKDRAQHQTVKENLRQLEKMTVGEPKFDVLMHETMRTLEEHIREEEQLDLPKLMAAISRDQSHKLSRKFERTKKFAPTRAHPQAPSKPPFENIVGLMTAPMDKLKDMFKTFPKDEEIKAAQTQSS